MDSASPLAPVATVHLAPGKDRPVRLGHPWIFSGALADLDPALLPGSVVRVCGADGALLGLGCANPRVAIAVRLLTTADEPIDDAFVQRRLTAAAALRETVVDPDTTAYRLLNGEGDGLPGIVTDVYGDVLVVQCLTAGAERLRPLVLDALVAARHPRAIYERSDGSVRRAEGLSGRAAVVHGELPAAITVRENGLAFRVDPPAGQKTGLFLDQRPNHALVRRLAGGRSVLDAFAYTGGFAVHAGAGGAARVVAVESSAHALATARINWSLNGLPDDTVEFVGSDVANYLRATADRFDLVIVDPPALVKRRADLEHGARAYRDLHAAALRCAAPQAFVLTFTCSQHVGAEPFRRLVTQGATAAGRPVQVLGHLGPGPDHPVALAHPEAEYLHGLLLRVH
jgi:23S rRNA (cytosine1962-C5)-methyltransferase